MQRLGTIAPEAVLKHEASEAPSHSRHENDIYYSMIAAFGTAIIFLIRHNVACNARPLTNRMKRPSEGAPGKNEIMEVDCYST